MSRNKLILKNTTILVIRNLISLSVSFYSTRIILQQLGASDYGLFSVIYGAVIFFSFIITAMNDSVQRYIAIGVGSKKNGSVKDAVKNSLLIFFCLGLVLGVCLLVAKNIIIYNILNIPGNSLESASIVYVSSVFTIIILVFQTPFNSLVLAYERMSFYGYMLIFDMASKLVVALLLTLTLYNKLLFYSFFLAGISIINVFVYFLYCNHFFKDALTGGNFNVNILKEISTFSLWNVLGNFSYVCRIQGVNMAINVFFSTTVNAAYAVSSTILNAVNSLAQSLVTALRPQIFKTYSESNYSRYTALIMLGSKYTFLFLFLMGSPILLCADTLLKIWLNDVPLYSVSFVRFIIVVALIDGFSFSIIAGIQATGKIKTYQMVVSFFTLTNLLITYYLFKSGFDVLSMFIPLIFTTSINLGLRVYFISKNSCFDWLYYMRNVVFPCMLAGIISFALGFFITKYLNPEGLVSTLFVCFVISLSNAIVFLVIVVSEKEKRWLSELLKRKMN